jgi:two-component system, cell cycle sensor histidine kinase and response regulator CckA
VASRTGAGPQDESTRPAAMDCGDLASSAIVRHAIETRQKYVLDASVSHGELTADLPVRRELIRSLVCAPLLAHGRLTGVLCLENPAGAGAFTADRTASLDSLLAQAALVLENAVAYATLEQSERKYRHIVDSASEGVWMLDAAGRTTFVNARMAEMLGYTPEEMAGIRALDLIFPEDREDAARRLAARREGVAETFERRFRRKDGECLWTQIAASPIRDAEGRFLGSFGMFTDITGRKRSEQEFALMNFALGKVSEMACLLDERGNVIWANDEACRLLEYSRDELLRLRVVDFSLQYTPDRWRIHWADIKAHGSVFLDSLFRSRTGREFPVEVNANFIEYLGRGYSMALIRDVAERRRAEEERERLREQLQQAQKLESVGRLAGGVAHDFNNLLTIINGYSELMLAQMPPGDPYRRMVEEIQEAGERAAGLTRPLLAFSRRQVVKPQSVSVDSVVADADRMLRRMLPEDIEMVTHLDARDTRVMADPVQLHQVLLNLVVNARDAMLHGGRLVLETGIVTLDAAYREAHPATPPDLAEDVYILLTVSDTGIGMDESVRCRIFEPFFTTKEAGVGTGLGLSTVYGIVSRAGGRVWVESEPGAGATFRVLLPRCTLASQAEEEPKLDRRLAKGSETILVVEDQEAVRRLASVVLRHCGYRVLEAANGADALVLLERYRDPVHLLLTDVVMPGMTGPELAGRIRAIHPDIKVVCMSGYMTEALDGWGVHGGEVAFIGKPFTPASLANEVRKVLGGAAGPKTVLVSGGHPEIRELLIALLESERYHVMGAEGGRATLDAARLVPPQLIVADLDLPGESGLEVIETIRHEHPEVKVVAISDGYDSEARHTAQNLGAAASLARPLTRAELLATVARALDEPDVRPPAIRAATV